MRTKQYTTTRLVELFKTNKIATMDELKAALSTRADATVFRKLATLAYRSSYSHRGRYYTLEDIPRYDQMGLWSFREVWFSSRGTLLATAESLVEEADAGYFSTELESLFHVQVKGCLLKLVREQRIAREKLFAPTPSGSRSRTVSMTFDATVVRSSSVPATIPRSSPSMLSKDGGVKRDDNAIPTLLISAFWPMAGAATDLVVACASTAYSASCATVMGCA